MPFPAALQTAIWLKELAAGGQDQPHRRHQFRYAAYRGISRGGSAAGKHAGAVFAARCAARTWADRSLRQARRPPPVLWLGGRRLSQRPMATDSAEPQPPFENRSLTKYKLIIDDFGGWELFQELLRVLARDRRSPWRRYRDCRQPCHAGPAASGGRHRRRAQPQPSAGESGDHGSAPDAGRSCRKLMRSWRSAEGPDGDTFTLERDRAGRAWIDHEIQSQQAGFMTPLAAAAAQRNRGAACPFRGIVHRPLSGLDPRAQRPSRLNLPWSRRVVSDLTGQPFWPVSRRPGGGRFSHCDCRYPRRFGKTAIRPCSNTSSNSIVMARRPGACRRLSSKLEADAPCGVVWRYLHETWMRDAEKKQVQRFPLGS